MEEQMNNEFNETEVIDTEVNDIVAVEENTKSGINLKDAGIGAAIAVGIAVAYKAGKKLAPKVKAGVEKLKAKKHNKELTAAKKDETAIDTVEEDFAEVEEK